MIEAVTDVIVARSRAPEALTPMVVWSLTAHAVLIAFVLFAPRTTEVPPPRTVMTISLGGAAGPRTGGMTQAAGRTVQAPAPVEPVRRAETAPAPVPPPMTLPDPRARTRPQAKPTQAPPQATGRTPTTGEKPEAGSTPAQTQVRGQGFGLSSAGGGGTGVELEVGNFCCPEYLEQMVAQIKRNWSQNQGMVATNVMRFTIARDGRLTAIQVFQPSGFTALDLESQRALLKTERLPPLPAAYPNASLTIRMRFEYQR